MRFSVITGGALIALSSPITSAFAQRGSETVTIRGNGASCPVAQTATPTAATLATFESGATVAVLDSAMLGATGARTLSEALATRLPGVSVMRSGGGLGIGSRVRMRGESGVLQMREPLLVIDGQRVEGELQSIALPSEDAAPSRLDDIDVNDVQCIIVSRGPAASALYGTDAAAGVIHVITRRAGEAGTGWRSFVEGGATTDAGAYPANFGSTPTSGSTPARCTRADVALGTCVAGLTRSWSPLEALSPFRTSPAGRVGAQYSRRVPDRLSVQIASGASYEEGRFRHSSEGRASLRGNAQFRLSPSLRMSAGAWVLRRETALPAVGGNALIGILTQTLLGKSVDDSIRGYRSLPLSTIESFFTTQQTHRLLGDASIEWTPRQWLSIAAFAGRETVNSDDRQNWLYPLFSPGSPAAGDTSLGDSHATHATYAVTATASYALGRGLALSTVAGFEQASNDRRNTYSRTIWRGDLSAEESSFGRADFRTRALFATQQIAWSNRRFITLGARRDNLSSIVDLGDVTYPFASLSWELGKEPFFPAKSPLSSLRLRAAYGESGDLRPLFLPAAQLAVFGVPIGTPTVTGPGMERSAEFEWGLVAGMLHDRATLDATFFRKTVRDGVTTTPQLPPASGQPPSPGVFNAVDSRTTGLELTVRASLGSPDAMGGELGISYTHMHNEVLDVAVRAPVIRSGGAGSIRQVIVGYPLDGVWAKPMTFSDANGDGVIVPAEVTIGDEASYLGPSMPTRELGVWGTIHPTRRLSMRALLDYRGGFKQLNWTSWARCGFVICEDLYAAGTSLSDQARAVAADMQGGAWIEDGDFVRLREVSISWRLSARTARLVGARTANVTLAVRNLATWTAYTGLEPEASGHGQSSILPVDMFSVPVARTFSLRLDAGW